MPAIIYAVGQIDFRTVEGRPAVEIAGYIGFGKAGTVVGQKTGIGAEQFCQRRKIEFNGRVLRVQPGLQIGDGLFERLILGKISQFISHADELIVVSPTKIAWNSPEQFPKETFE